MPRERGERREERGARRGERERREGDERGQERGQRSGKKEGERRKDNEGRKEREVGGLACSRVRLREEGETKKREMDREADLQREGGC